MKKVLIVGANFNNKGAQSMLFVTMDAVKRMCPECEAYFATAELYNECLYRFKHIYSTYAAKQIALDNHKFFYIVRSTLKDAIKVLAHRKTNLWKFTSLNDIIKEIDLIVDVSGYNLGDKWSVENHESFFDNIRLAQKYSIPIYLMPQSFGPFNYSDDKKYLLDEMRELLPYPKVIFAREKEGKQLLEETFRLKNVVLSTDLVLQNSGIDYENVFYSVPELHLPVISDDNNVGIIPNKQCFKFGDNEAILKLYEQIIDKLLSAGKNVYLFRHSFEDLEFCYMIKERFADNEKVVVFDNDFSCLEYDAFVRKFDFIVCSRFHGIVHAYKNGVPCIALGWAVKYKELAENVSQGQFVLNIADDIVDAKHLDEIVSYMIENYKSESEIIKAKVAEIQKSNCFSVLEELK